MTSRRLAMVSLVLWVVLAAALGWLLLRSYSAPAPDGRTVLDFTASEQEFVLTQMRGVLANVQSIVDGLATGNAQLVAESARKNGAAAMTAEVSLMVKLPPAFQQLNLQLHTGFDELAAAAGANESREALLQRLSGLLGTCVACHATYRVMPVGAR